MTQAEYIPPPKHGKHPSEQLLSLCMIVRNEERLLGDCLRSVRGVVDEIVIVDTGSTDQTIAIAEVYHAKVFHFAWNGSFADARNEALGHCSCRYVLQLDADERLEDRDRDRLREMVKGPLSDAVELSIVSRMSDGKRISHMLSEQPRLFRRDPRFRYRYRIHETVLPSIREACGSVTKENITIRHLGYDVAPDALKKKNERNYEQLVLGVQEHPHDLFILKKYAQTLLVVGRNAEAAREISHTLEKIDAGACGEVGAGLRATFYNLYAEALLKTGNIKAAYHWASQSLRLVKEQNMAHYYLMKIHDHLGDHERALKHLDAIVLKRKDRPAAQVEDDVAPAPQDVCYKRATLYRAMKKPVDERMELEAALRLDPHMTPALYHLAALWEKENNFVQALSFITRAREEEPRDGAIASLRARILFRMQRMDEAVRDAADAFACGEKNDALLRLWIQAARTVGKEADARPACALLLERHPSAVEVLMPYIQMLVQANELHAAMRAVERSLPSVADEAMRHTLKAIHEKLALAAQVI